MIIAVPKEITFGETRVALVPDAVSSLVKEEVEVLIESGAGSLAYFSDEEYVSAGASIVPDVKTLFQQAEVVLKVNAPDNNTEVGSHEIEMMAKGTTVIGCLQPLVNLDLVRMLVNRHIVGFSIDTIPRIARAQKMDVLSAMSSLVGYKSVIIAASLLGKYFPMMMTAAGTVAPARGLVIGAGVAGLQAIATARRLGAVVEAFDVRPIVKEQVESLGATFIDIGELDDQSETTGGYATEQTEDSQTVHRKVIHEHVKTADFVITTALIPGKPAPILLTAAMVDDMAPGSVIVDLAGEMGGNCELTKPGSKVSNNGVVIDGPINIPSSMPKQASQLYSRNIVSLLQHLVKDGQIHVDFDDEITKGCCITNDGVVVHGQTADLMMGNVKPN